MLSSTSIVAAASTQSTPFLSQTPTAQAPPPGFIRDIYGPNPNGTIHIVVSIIGAALCTSLVAIRIYTKSVLTRALGWDDYTCVLSLIAGLIFAVALNGMGRHAWDNLQTNGEKEHLRKVKNLHLL
ncbi:hypothetical protein MMC22_002136 [Lobaria immixta]|nr:hypothetical protein [Lobaria immixta]